MMRYDVIEDYDLTRFTSRVESMINIGWKLQGGIIVGELNRTTSIHGHVYLQAIIKEDERK